MARSTAGSGVFTPPATLTKTSSAARRISARFSRTAMIIATRSDDTPLAFRLAAPMTLEAVRACTSTSSTREPCMAAVMTDPLGWPPGPYCSMNSFPGSVTSRRPVAGHLEQADFVRAAEAVLHASHDAMGMEAVALEIRDGIDDVLDELGAGQRALLGDMPDQNDRRAAGLGQVNQVHAAIAQLRDRPRRGGKLRLVNHLDRIDDGHGRLMPRDLMKNSLDVRFGQDQKLIRFDAQSSGPQGGLAGRFLAGDVKHLGRVGRRRHRVGDLKQESRFADARLPADQHDRAGNDSAAEHAIEFGDAGGQSRRLRFVDLSDGQCFGRGGQIAAAHDFRTRFSPGIGNRRRVGFQAVPCPAIGTFAHPFRMHAAAMIAKKLAAHFGHGACSMFAAAGPIRKTGRSTCGYVVHMNAPAAEIGGLATRSVGISRPRTRSVYHGIQIAQRAVTATMVPRTIPRRPMWP